MSPRLITFTDFPSSTIFLVLPIHQNHVFTDYYPQGLISEIGLISHCLFCLKAQEEDRGLIVINLTTLFNESILTN